MKGFQVLTAWNSITPPPLEFLSNLNGFAKPEIRNCSKGNVSSSFVYDNKRTSTAFAFKEVSFSNLFLIELIFNCPIIICFGFSSLRFCKVIGALLPLLFLQLLSFVSWKEKVDFSGWFLLQWFNFWKLLSLELTDVILLWVS